MKTSKSVQNEINHTYAVLASAVAKRAVRHIEADNYGSATAAMIYVERWLIKAGAQSASLSYSRPKS